MAKPEPLDTKWLDELLDGSIPKDSPEVKQAAKIAILAHFHRQTQEAVAATLRRCLEKQKMLAKTSFKQDVGYHTQDGIVEAVPVEVLERELDRIKIGGQR